MASPGRLGPSAGGQTRPVPLPPLYVEGLLGEALLKETLRELEGDARPDVVADNARTALDVTLWELRPPWRD